MRHSTRVQTMPQTLSRSWFLGWWHWSVCHITHWLVVEPPLLNILIKWDYCSQYIWKNKIHVPNHQPAYHYTITYRGRCIMIISCGQPGLYHSMDGYQGAQDESRSLVTHMLSFPASTWPTVIPGETCMDHWKQKEGDVHYYYYSYLFKLPWWSVKKSLLFSSEPIYLFLWWSSHLNMTETFMAFDSQILSGQLHITGRDWY